MPVGFAGRPFNQPCQQQGDKVPTKLVVQTSPGLQLAIGPQQLINQAKQVADLVERIASVPISRENTRKPLIAARKSRSWDEWVAMARAARSRAPWLRRRATPP